MRLLKLVNTLLDFSRIEAGRVEAVYEPTDLAALTAELASSFRSAASGPGCGCTSTARRCAQPVYVDRDMWEKVVLNLLSNAFKFTFEGGIAVTLRGDGRTAPSCAVSDTGIGIPQRELPRLFERFHRVEGAQGAHARGQRHRPGAGAGAGAAARRRRSRVESEVGDGTTFTVVDPARHGAPAAPSGSAAGAPRASTATRRRGLSSRRRCAGCRRRRDGRPAPRARRRRRRLHRGRGRILLADDNADMRDYLRALLARR